MPDVINTNITKNMKFIDHKFKEKLGIQHEHDAVEEREVVGDIFYIQKGFYNLNEEYK